MPKGWNFLKMLRKKMFITEFIVFNFIKGYIIFMLTNPKY